MNLTKRAIASRANGAKSRGPKTSAGRARSAQNSIRHGLLAKCIIVKGECPDAFQKVLDYHIATFGPANEVELGLIEEMVAAQWRMRRMWTIETNLFDAAVERHTETTDEYRFAAAFSELASGNELKLLDRYESRLHRMYERSRKMLLENQQLDSDEENTELPNEPNPPSRADALVRAQSPDCAVDDPENDQIPNEPTNVSEAAEPSPEPETDPLPNEPNSPTPEPETQLLPEEQDPRGADVLVRAQSPDCAVQEPAIRQIPNEPNSANSETPNEPKNKQPDADADEDDFEYDPDTIYLTWVETPQGRRLRPVR